MMAFKERVKNEWEGEGPHGESEAKGARFGRSTVDWSQGWARNLAREEDLSQWLARHAAQVKVQSGRRRENESGKNKREEVSVRSTRIWSMHVGHHARKSQR